MRSDHVLIWAWVPFAIAAFWIGRSSGGAGLSLEALAAGVFLLSFSHQTLSLPLVYGDSAVFRQKRALFALAPFLALAGVLLVGWWSFALLAAIGAVWNTEHTLMQRYGMVRIYGRKVGQNKAGAELGLVFAWFVAALLVATSRGLGDTNVTQLGLSRLNDRGLQYLEDARLIALLLVVPALVVATLVTVRWIAEEFGSGRARNPAKYWYLGSTGLLFCVGVVEPAAGLMGFVGSHAVEYYLVVDRTVAGKYQTGSPEPSVLARLVQRGGTPRRVAVGLLYVGVVLALVYGLKGTGSQAYLPLVLSIGVCHFVFDTVIWKLRKPENARALALATA